MQRHELSCMCDGSKRESVNGAPEHFGKTANFGSMAA